MFGRDFWDRPDSITKVKLLLAISYKRFGFSSQVKSATVNTCTCQEENWMTGSIVALPMALERGESWAGV